MIFPLWKSKFLDEIRMHAIKRCHVKTIMKFSSVAGPCVQLPSPCSALLGTEACLVHTLFYS